MRKFIIGFILGSFIFGGAVIAREQLIDFSEESITTANEMFRKLWYAVEDRAIRDDTPSLEFHDVDSNAAYMFHYDDGSTCAWEFALYIGTDYKGADFNISSTYRQPFLGFDSTGGVFMPYIKQGATQAAAGAGAGEIWADTDIENTLKLGT